MWIEDSDVASELQQTVSYLWAVPGKRLNTISRRSYLTHITHKTSVSINANVAHNTRKKRARLPNKRNPVVLFIFTWSFSNKRNAIGSVVDNGLCIRDYPSLGDDLWDGCSFNHI